MVERPFRIRKVSGSNPDASNLSLHFDVGSMPRAAAKVYCPRRLADAPEFANNQVAMPEWLRGLTRNQMRFPRVGSNPTGDDLLLSVVGKSERLREKQ